MKHIICDLWAFMQTLPADTTPNRDHELQLPFRLRRGLGLWKRMFLSEEPVIEISSSDEKLLLGRYLVEGPGHCAECHTPRNLLGGLEKDKWMAGGPSPEGEGKIPNITPHPSALGDWSLTDIAYALESGFTPEFDSFGGSMAAVQRNMARLSAADREAIAAYLKAIPEIASP